MDLDKKTIEQSP